MPRYFIHCVGERRGGPESWRERDREKEREREREQPLRESLALSPERLGGPTSKVVMPVSILETMDTEDTP